MKPFEYHAGQRAIQREANSVACADKLAPWVGPVAEFAEMADLVILTAPGDEGVRIGALSGPAPLVRATAAEGEVTLRFPAALATAFVPGAYLGGIVINPARARRSRFGGPLRVTDGECAVSCTVAFTNCRKYIVPTVSAGDAPRLGPRAAAELALDDPWLVEVLARGEMAFLVTATPHGTTDASHRGGPPGFLRYAPDTATLEWTEYLGDGMFVSLGNLRAAGKFSLVVLEEATGDALRLDAVGEYLNLRADRKERVDALLQAGEPYPVQGRLTARARRAWRLHEFVHPRRRVDGGERITSLQSTQEQHP